MYEIFVPVQLSNSKWNEFSADFFRLFSVNYNVGEMAIAVYLVSNKCVLSHLVVLVKLAALTKWLARSTSLRTPICGKEIEKWGIIPRKPRRKSAYDLFGPVYYFIVLLCLFCLRTLHHLLRTPYNLFVLKVPFKHQSRNQPYSRPRIGVRSARLRIHGAFLPYETTEQNIVYISCDIVIASPEMPNRHWLKPSHMTGYISIHIYSLFCEQTV